MPPLENAFASDPIAEKLKLISQNILVVIFGLLPLFFLPLSAAPFDYSKTLVVIIGIASALILFSLSVLRSGQVSFSFSYSLIALWGVAFIAFLSAFFSGDARDAFVGDQLSVHSAFFVVLLALSASVWGLIGTGRLAIMRLYVLLSASTIILVLFHMVRLIFGADIFSFNVFQSSVSSPIGGWNDLALFLGLAILLSLVALEQLKLNKIGKVLFVAATVLSLIMLAVINFFAVWLVLGLVSLVVLVYALAKDRPDLKATLFKVQTFNLTSLILSLVVFIISVLFVIGGPFFGGLVNKYTDISFIEVRPSAEATVGIARGVYAEHALLGIGTNRFTDAWRLNKDPAINTTMFWNTDFNAGSGYVPTFFVTTGVLGGVAWLLFLGIFMYMGIRNLLRIPNSDRIWYFIGVSSFVSAVYIWVMAVVYVPGPVILFLGAVCTGLAILSTETLSGIPPKSFSIRTNRRAGFVFTLVVIAVVIGSVQVLYAAGQHYAAAYTFNEAQQLVRPGSDVTLIESKIDKAFEFSPSDTFARSAAEYQFNKMNTLLAVEAPTDAEQQQFQNALVSGIESGRLATERDNTEPANYAVLGSIYGLLVPANIEGAYDRAYEALSKARDYDPKNPLRYLALAQLESRANKLDEARALTEEAIALKQNYSDALFFLTQLDIVSGNVDAAITSAQAIISLEPQNPARYYQLGVLESSQRDTEAAVAAFERAISLDPNYANALYFLALEYDTLGRTEEARGLLERVLRLNPGNEDVVSLIQAIDTTGSLGESAESETQPIALEASVIEESGVVSATEEPDSTLLTPVNTAPSEENVEETGVDATQ